jgi:uncharacterized membrane protein YhaH (DUF805 family)
MAIDTPRKDRLSFVPSVIRTLRLYATFSGRASVAEYWWFALFQALVWTPVYLTANVIVGGRVSDSVGALLLGMSLVLIVAALSLVIPALAVTVRRLHDTDRTGWWALLVVVPLVAVILYLFMLLPGTGGRNTYGPQPD